MEGNPSRKKTQDFTLNPTIRAIWHQKANQFKSPLEVRLPPGIGWIGVVQGFVKWHQKHRGTGDGWVWKLASTEDEEGGNIQNPTPKRYSAVQRVIESSSNRNSELLSR